MKRIALLAFLFSALMILWIIMGFRKLADQIAENYRTPVIDLKDSPAEELFLSAAMPKAPLTQKSAKEPEQIYEEADYVVKIEVWQFEKVPLLNRMQPRSSAFGSGIVVACGKHRFCVLTAGHVTNLFAPTFYAHFKDGTPPQKLELIGQSDQKYDTALLRFTDPNFQPKKAAILGQASKLKPGAKIMAIGSNTFGDFWFSADGYLYKEVGPPTSALRETIASVGLPDYPKVMLVKTEIFRGYSGGPLLNEEGEVVGIVTAYLTLDAIIINLGIPAEEIKEAMEKILSPT
jgi:S1-C subfamily serine protease